MAFRIMTVVGARPQFIKAAVVSHELQGRGAFEEELVHTGQHYDHNMSQAFFDELDIPEPAVNLGIAGGSHAEMTARMLVALEGELLSRKPDMLLLYGDTNSTLAGALAAAKLHVPICHVEAGARTRSMTNPEEINRICTDHVAGLLLACTEANLANLAAEGLSAMSSFLGDPMYDAFLQYSAKARKPALESIVDGSELAVPQSFYYATCHREENTADDGVLAGFLEALASLDLPVVYPVHPRNRAHVAELARSGGYANILLCQPVGYLESVWLVNRAEQVLTDSGGLQREAFFARVKCTTLLDFEVWPETMVGNRNLLASPTIESISSAMTAPQEVDPSYTPFGDGRASARIADAIERYLEG